MRDKIDKLYEGVETDTLGVFYHYSDLLRSLSGKSNNTDLTLELIAAALSRYEHISKTDSRTEMMNFQTFFDYTAELGCSLLNIPEEESVIRTLNNFISSARYIESEEVEEYVYRKIRSPHFVDAECYDLNQINGDDLSDEGIQEVKKAIGISFSDKNEQILNSLAETFDNKSLSMLAREIDYGEIIYISDLQSMLPEGPVQKYVMQTLNNKN